MRWQFILPLAAKNKGWNADNDTVYQYQSHQRAIFPAITVGPGAAAKNRVHQQPESISNT